MEYLDDDMEDLFRKAAHDYNVRLPDEQWDAVAGRLIAGSTGLASVDTPDNKKKKRRFFLLGLLSGLFLAIFLYIGLYKGLGFHPGPVRKNMLTGEKDKGRMQNGSPLERTPGLADLKMMDPKIRSLQGVFSKKPETKFDKKDGGTRSAGEGEVSETSGDKAKNAAETMPIVQPVSVNKHQKNVGNLVTRRFYFGLIAGPQFNQVKNQGFSKPGISAGLMAGIQVKPSLAFETGFIFSGKTYYSSGGYFSMSKIASSMPAGMKLIDMKGKATVLEIPVTVKIDIRKTNHSRLFVAGGVSSYLLIHENNAYQVVVNGGRESLSDNYSHTEKYLSAAINISAGYEYKITGKKTFRIQPYLQIPVKGIGVGALPILGAGINLGIFIP